MEIRDNYVGVVLISDGKIIKYQRNVSKEVLIILLEVAMEQDPTFKEAVETVGKKPDLEFTSEFKIPEGIMAKFLEDTTKMEPGKLYFAPKGKFKFEKGGEE